MLINNGNISMTMMNGLKQVREDYKKFLYARAIHSSHTMQYHMQQITEHQQVVDGYRSMMEEERELTPLESNLYKSDPAVISHIIHMIEVDNFGIKRPLKQSYLTSGGTKKKKSTTKKIGHYTVKKMGKPTKNEMKKKLLTSVMRVRPQPATTGKPNQVRNKKTTTWRRAKQLQEWRNFNCKKLRKTKS